MCVFEDLWFQEPLSALHKCVMYICFVITLRLCQEDSQHVAISHGRHYHTQKATKKLNDFIVFITLKEPFDKKPWTVLYTHKIVFQASFLMFWSILWKANITLFINERSNYELKRWIIRRLPVVFCVVFCVMQLLLWGKIIHFKKMIPVNQANFPA